MFYIYQITNKQNGKRYIGKTSTSVETRWNRHRWDASRPKPPCRHLYFAINKYGSSSFSVKQIDCTESEQEANELERLYIGIFQSYKKHKGYNLTLGGEGCLGARHSEEYKENLRRKQKGIPPSLQCLQKAWAINTGKPCLEETKKKISEAQKGKPRLYARKPHSPEWNKKIGDAQRGDKRPNYRRDVDVDKVIALYLSGKSANQIGIMFGISKDSIRKRIVTSGVAFNSSRRGGYCEQ